jgi:lambda family phage portal protein
VPLLDFFRRKPTAERSAPKPRGPAPRAVMRMFESTKDDRMTSDWISMPQTAEWLIRMHQRVMVARSREQAANNDYAKAFLRMCRQNIVGPKGVMLLAQSRDDKGSLDTLANQAIEDAWCKWGHRASCDVAGFLSWRGMQAMAVQQAAKDGEFMFRKIYGKDAGPFGFALQLLDPQRCHPQFDQYDLPDGAFIRAGIEFNKYGRPIAYHFTVAKESDAYYNYSYAGLHYHRIPADEIIHGYMPDMVGQKRGLPWLSTGLWSLKQLHGFEDAAIVAARVGASKMGVIQWKEGRGPDMDDDELRNFEMTTEPGEFPVLPEGAELKDWNPQYPSGEFASQVKAMLRRFSAGAGVLYNNLANDLEGVNFSSIRQGTLDEREHWKELQEWLIETLVQPVFEAWLPRALLAGHITVKGRPLKPERIDRYREVSWQPRRWAWIDPSADVQAAVASKNNLLLSPGQIIRESGRDPGDVWREIAADIEAMKAAGIPDDFIKSAILDKNLQATVAAAKQNTTETK